MVTYVNASSFDFFKQIWEIKVGGDGKGTVEFISNLKRHTKSVNVCRFSPDGKTYINTSFLVIFHPFMRNIKSELCIILQQNVPSIYIYKLYETKQSYILNAKECGIIRILLYKWCRLLRFAVFQTCSVHRCLPIWRHYSPISFRVSILKFVRKEFYYIPASNLYIFNCFQVFHQCHEYLNIPILYT